MSAKPAWIREQLTDKFGEPPWKLNLGCGLDHVADWINVDIEPQAEPDLIWDLERPWQMPAKCIVEVEAKHVVEHLHDLKRFFQELYRVCIGGAEIVIKVPHQNSDFYWGDPTHVRPITKMMLDLLSKKACQFGIDNGYSNTPLAIYWDVDFEVYEQTFVLHDGWKDKFNNDMDKIMWAINTYNNVASEVQFKLRCVKGGLQYEHQYQSGE